MLSTIFLILSGSAVSSLILLTRNILIARLLPVEDYGIATTFAITMALIEMASTFGLPQQIVQSKQATSLRFRRPCRGFRCCAG